MQKCIIPLVLQYEHIPCEACLSSTKHISCHDVIEILWDWDVRFVKCLFNFVFSWLCCARRVDSVHKCVVVHGNVTSVHSCARLCTPVLLLPCKSYKTLLLTSSASFISRQGWTDNNVQLRSMITIIYINKNWEGATRDNHHKRDNKQDSWNYISIGC